MKTKIPVQIYRLLKQHWGYDTFRPKQEEAIRCLLNGRDAVAVMPTGGGKSLCYQLAAVALGGTGVVISPLIALMQDQVAQLGAIGIPAAFLNSSLDAAGQAAVMRKARAGKYRLLYLSPERLAWEDSIKWLGSVPVSFFAIDEAHCISEWGHEFRPDYRQLCRLRERFPGKPVAAFTASATSQVRHDIVEQLQLRDPGKFALSFYRPNLRFLVKLCDPRLQDHLLLSALKAHAGSNVIIYAPTIARVTQTVALLKERGIAAIPYHGQMETEDRRRNQKIWMADQVPVLVGTIAFGLGINKPSVRAVIHLSLPKSLEQYYQEAGRAGRDGQPADCLLLWQKRDAGLLAHFISQIEDPGERERGWRRYRTIRRFAEDETCRHRRICSHFGQRTGWDRCEMCDACGNMPEWFTSVPAATRLRPRRRSRVEVEPAALLPEPDSALLDHLKQWRLELARETGVPPYVILHDRSLAELCVRRPSEADTLLDIHGIGPAKVERYGKQILTALRAFRAAAAGD